MEKQNSVEIALSQVSPIATNGMFRSKKELSEVSLHELTDSIKMLGVIQPIAVRPEPTLVGSLLPADIVYVQGVFSYSYVSHLAVTIYIPEERVYDSIIDLLCECENTFSKILPIGITSFYVRICCQVILVSVHKI